MRRIGVAPVALVNFFLIASRLEASPGDFASVAEYENYLHRTATHPLSTQRILDIADGIQAHLDEFARLQADPPSARKKLEGMVSELRTIAVGLDDRKMRLFLAEQARSSNVATFRAACQH